MPSSVDAVLGVTHVTETRRFLLLVCEPAGRASWPVAASLRTGGQVEGDPWAGTFLLPAVSSPDPLCVPRQPLLPLPLPTAFTLPGQQASGHSQGWALCSRPSAVRPTAVPRLGSQTMGLRHRLPPLASCSGMALAPGCGRVPPTPTSRCSGAPSENQPARGSEFSVKPWTPRPSLVSGSALPVSRPFGTSLMSSPRIPGCLTVPYMIDVSHRGQ